MFDERFKTLKDTPAPDLWPDIQRREPGPPRREVPWGRLGTVVVASLVAISGVAFAVRAFLGQPLEEAPGELAPVDPRVTATVQVAAPEMRLRAVAAGEGGVWVVVWPDVSPGRVSESTLVKIDPMTNEVVAEVVIPGIAGPLAPGFGSVWVSTYSWDTGSSLVRVDATTNEIVAEIPGTGNLPLTAYGSVWTLRTGGTTEQPGPLFRVDPDTNEVVAEIPVPIELPLGDFSAGSDSIWVLGGRRNDRNLARIDPTTGSVVATIDLDFAHTNVFAGGDYVWIGTVLVGNREDDRPVPARVDPRTNTVSPESLEVEPFRPFAFAEGGLWFVGSPPDGPGGICRLDPATWNVDACVEPPSFSRAGIGVAHHPTTSSIWVLGDDGTVARIDLRP